MHGNFNGVQLKKIVWRKILKPSPGTTLTTFRALTKRIPELDTKLTLNTPGLLILSNQIVEGTIVDFSADPNGGIYEVTIQSKNGGETVRN
jgi:hypothetical protein